MTAAGVVPAVGTEAFGGLVIGRVEPPNREGWLLIAAPVNLEGDGLAWSTNDRRKAPEAARDHWDGHEATASLTRDDRYPAARHCDELPFPDDGASRWYLPSKIELALMELVARDTAYALNTDTRPWYWSSTERSAATAWYQDSGGSSAGNQLNANKTSTNIRVRPVRRVVLSILTFASDPRPVQGVDHYGVGWNAAIEHARSIVSQTQDIAASGEGIVVSVALGAGGSKVYVNREAVIEALRAARGGQR